MSATARFSKQFYERLGEDVADEMANWWDQERAELRELNNRNAERLDAKVDQFRFEMRAELANLRAELIKWSFIFFATAALAVIGLR